MGSIHLRGGESFLVLLFFLGLSRLVYPLYALWLFAFFLMHFLFTYKKNGDKAPDPDGFTMAFLQFS